MRPSAKVFKKNQFFLKKLIKKIISLPRAVGGGPRQRHRPRARHRRGYFFFAEGHLGPRQRLCRLKISRELFTEGRCRGLLGLCRGLEALGKEAASSSDVCLLPMIMLP